jgi:hypothetical protein
MDRGLKTKIQIARRMLLLKRPPNYVEAIESIVLVTGCSRMCTRKADPLPNYMPVALRLHAYLAATS